MVWKLTTRSTLAKRASPDLGVVRGGIAEIGAGGGRERSEERTTCRVAGLIEKLGYRPVWACPFCFAVKVWA